MHLPSLAQRLTSERNQAAAATHNNTNRFSRRTGIPIRTELLLHRANVGSASVWYSRLLGGASLEGEGVRLNQSRPW